MAAPLSRPSPRLVSTPRLTAGIAPCPTLFSPARLVSATSGTRSPRSASHSRHPVYTEIAAPAGDGPLCVVALWPAPEQPCLRGSGAPCDPPTAPLPFSVVTTTIV